MNKNTAITSACGIVWTGVVLISVLSPSLVTGSQQEHLPLAAITAWVWGLVSTGYLILLAAMQSPESDEHDWRGLVAGFGVIWAAATAISVLGPSLVTGTDPTRVPLAALIAPPAATIGSALMCLLTAIQAGSARSHFEKPAAPRPATNEA